MNSVRNSRNQDYIFIKKYIQNQIMMAYNWLHKETNLFWREGPRKDW